MDLTNGLIKLQKLQGDGLNLMMMIPNNPRKDEGPANNYNKYQILNPDLRK